MQAYFEPFGKLGLSSLEPGAYSLRAEISARASKPEPRLFPPLSSFQRPGLKRGLNQEKDLGLFDTQVHPLDAFC